MKKVTYVIVLALFIGVLFCSCGTSNAITTKQEKQQNEAMIKMPDGTAVRGYIQTHDCMIDPADYAAYVKIDDVTYVTSWKNVVIIEHKMQNKEK